MSPTTRRIRQMSVVVESEIPVGLTLAEYRSWRRREDPPPPRGRLARLRRR